METIYEREEEGGNETDDDDDDDDDGISLFCTHTKKRTIR